MPTAALITLGCKVNQYDTQAMQEIMLRNGYTVVGENDPADVCIINTCTVTNAADQKPVKSSGERFGKIPTLKSSSRVVTLKVIGRRSRRFRASRSSSAIVKRRIFRSTWI